MDIINKEVTDGIFLSAKIQGGKLSISAEAGLAYLLQKLDDNNDNPFVSAAAQILKAVAEKV